MDGGAGELRTRVGSGARVTRPLPSWAEWQPSSPFTVGVEEEIMLLDPVDGSLAHDAERVLADLSPHLHGEVSAETHACALELGVGPHEDVPALARELAGRRRELARVLRSRGVQAASAGTHPLAQWTDVQVSSGARYQSVHRTMRELARREPTFALHVHVGVEDPERAVALFNRLRGHIPLFLAVSANSPFWQGRDSGLASMRTPLFQAFPRVGIPRSFSDYAEWVEAVDLLLRCGVFPEPTFLWWDVRMQPRLGTVEVRVMDAQATAAETGALCALVQSVARMELEERYLGPTLLASTEALIENRFLAARDGMSGELLDPAGDRRVPAPEILRDVTAHARPHAEDLGCEDELDAVETLGERTGAERQREIAGPDGDLREVLAALAADFAAVGRTAVPRAGSTLG